MNKKLSDKLLSTAVYVILAVGCLAFVFWIAQMSYDNTCIELQEEYVSVGIREEVNNIQTSIDFGKDLDNFYGMDEIIESICQQASNDVRVIVTDVNIKPLYTSMPESDDSVKALSHIFDNNFVNNVKSIDPESKGEVLDYGDDSCLVFPINSLKKGHQGFLVAVYSKNDFLEDSTKVTTTGIGENTFLIVMSLFVVVLVAICKFAFEPNFKSEKWYVKHMMVIIIMMCMMVFIMYMYSSFTVKQEKLIRNSANVTASFAQKAIVRLQNKGLSLDNLDMVSEYLNNMVDENKSIESISVVKNYYFTNDAESLIALPISNGEAYVNISVNRNFIQEKLNSMRLMFGAVFIICLMITYEMTKLPQIVTSKFLKKKNSEVNQLDGVPDQIRLLSFMTYTALYTSTPYAAVIMRSWKASVFGLSPSVSASLPLTIELLCVLIASLIIQKFFADFKLSRMTYLVFPIIILCNAACASVNSPYLLIILRALCGIGFAFLKYWLNSYVAAGSTDDKAIQKNFAELNGGLLCGITIGASLGSIMAESKGYQFNYYFTAIICVAVLVVSVLLMPWKEIDEVRLAGASSKKEKSGSFLSMLKNADVLKALFVGDVPLNIGLMYVVSFLPVYMSAVGQSGVVTSYAYLINGLAGVYVGVFMIRLLRKVSTFIGSVIALFLGAAGILVLVLGGSAGIILLSAGIMGLMDGYGTPTITGFFTGLKGTEDMDKAGMLTLFSSVGSAVQIACPVLYNIIIQPDGKTTYLFIFGLCFAAAAVLFFLLLGGKQLRRASDSKG